MGRRATIFGLGVRLVGEVWLGWVALGWSGLEVLRDVGMETGSQSGLVLNPFEMLLSIVRFALWAFTVVHRHRH